MIEFIKPQGKLLHECGIEGERQSDDVYPAQINGCQLSADRWMLIFATRGWRNVDDDIELLTPITLSREKGFEEGAEFCRRGAFSWMNQNITQSVP